MIIGSSAPNVLQLADHLLNIPLFAALVNESEKTYEGLEAGGIRAFDHLTTKEIEAMKLPPKPQLKGFQPQRTKASVRTLTLLTRDLKSRIRRYMLLPDEDVRYTRGKEPKKK